MLVIDLEDRNFLSLIPGEPGVYMFLDVKQVVLYVGKAKNLKLRIRSYFAKNQNSAKVEFLKSKSKYLDFFIVENESEALLLENTLIKKHKPRYNVLLKDDKTYPWIVIKNENFPRVMFTRKIVNDGSTYYGPFASAAMVKTLIELIRKLYPLRTCNLNISDDNIKKKHYKPCLEFHIGNCLAPCIGNQTKDSYLNNIALIKKIFNGELKEVIELQKSYMTQAANKLNFEYAQKLKVNIDLLNEYFQKSVVVNTKIKNLDVFSYLIYENWVIFNYIKIVNGAIIQSYSNYIKLNDYTNWNDLYGTLIFDLHNRFNSLANEIIVPDQPEFKIINIKYTIPRNGDKKKLLDLSYKNVKTYFENILLPKLKDNDSENNINPILYQIKEDLRLKNIPVYIECFDNSNIQGKFPVAACVVFKYGKPNKAEYRHYHVKSVLGPDDFATMKEIVFRRYHRLLKENAPLPDLIIIDGGKGQLNAAVESLKELNIFEKTNIISIAKRLEEIYVTDDSLPLFIAKNSSTLLFIQKIRDEAHRFAIDFHRKSRSKVFVKSVLDECKGLSEKDKIILIKKFKSVNNIALANEDELENLIGRKKKNLLIKFLKNL